MFDLVNVFDVFLSQLLSYPNPTDPLNGEAAALQLREPDKYSAKVKEYVAKFASSNDPCSKEGEETESESASTMSAAETDESLEMDPWIGGACISDIITLTW